MEEVPGTYMCKNVDCSNIESGEKGEICHLCGKEYGKVFYNQEEALKADKLRKREDKELSKTKFILYNEDMTEDDIKSRIYDDMEKIARHEAGSELANMDAIMSLNPDAQITSRELKTLIEQNKLIIRQNELIYRQLKRINEREDIEDMDEREDLED